MKKILLLLACVLSLNAYAEESSSDLDVETAAPQKVETSKAKVKAEKKLALSPQAERLYKLAPEEREIYQYGEISTGSLVGGGLLGTLVGLGTGHIVYGQYGIKGWIFTVGELGALAIAVAGTTKAVGDCIGGNCNGSGMGAAVIGAIGFYGFRIWEIVDVWSLPSRHNNRFQQIKGFVEDGEVRSGGIMFAPMIQADNRGNSHYGLQAGFQF